MDILPLDVEKLIYSYLLECKKCNKYEFELFRKNRCFECMFWNDSKKLFNTIIIITLSLLLLEISFIYICIMISRAL